MSIWRWLRPGNAERQADVEALETLRTADFMLLASVVKLMLDVLPPASGRYVKEQLRKLVAERMGEVETPVAPGYEQLYRDRLSAIAQVLLGEKFDQS